MSGISTRLVAESAPARLLSLCVLLLLAVAPAAAAAAAASVDAGALSPALHSNASNEPGEVREYRYAQGGLGGSYLQYTPASYRSARAPVPLLVVLHGCATTAEQQMRANLQNVIAERERFVIIYPQSGWQGDAFCWEWSTSHRNVGDAAVVAGMTRQVMQRLRIDQSRVYVIGMSSGGMLTSVLVASYPDLYAAAGLMAGIAYKDLTCTFTGVTLGPDFTARRALAAEGARARVVPMIVLGGDKDNAVYPSCQDTATQQWVQTNSLVSGQPLRKAVTRTVPKKAGYTSSVTQYTSLQGCPVVEQWQIHGLGHFWSGGTSDPEYATWTDPKGPNAGEISWRFFSRYRLQQHEPLSCSPS